MANKNNGWEALKNSYANSSYGASGWDALKNSYANSVDNSPKQTSTRKNVMDMAINSLMDRAANSTIGKATSGLTNRFANSTIGRATSDWANRVGEHIDQRMDERQRTREWLQTEEGKKAIDLATRKNDQDWINFAQDLDIASSQYEGPTRTERIRGVSYDNTDGMSANLTPKEHEYSITVRNENYNPLSREERDDLISRYIAHLFSYFFSCWISS